MKALLARALGVAEPVGGIHVTMLPFARSDDMRCSVPDGNSVLFCSSVVFVVVVRNVFVSSVVGLLVCSSPSSSHARLLRVTAMMQWNLPCGHCGTTCAQWLVHPCSTLTLALLLPPQQLHLAQLPRAASAAARVRCLCRSRAIVSWLSTPTPAQRERGRSARLAPVLAGGKPVHSQGLRLAWLRVRARAAGGARTRLPSNHRV